MCWWMGWWGLDGGAESGAVSEWHGGAMGPRESGQMPVKNPVFFVFWNLFIDK